MISIELPKGFFLGVNKEDICKNKVIFSDKNKTVEVTPILEEDGIGVPIPEEFIEEHKANVNMVFVKEAEDIDKSNLSVETKDATLIINGAKMSSTYIPIKIYAIE